MPDIHKQTVGPHGEWPSPPPYLPPPPPPGRGQPPPGRWDQPPVPAGPPDGRTPRAAMYALVAALVVGILVVVGGFGLGWRLATGYVHGTSPIAQIPISSAPQQNPSNGGKLDVQAVARKVEPAVVEINTVVSSFGQTGQAAGTGMILTSSGEVLTNNHVVQGASSVKVSISGRSRSYTANVLGVDPRADVALLQLQSVTGLPTVTLAASSVTLGEDVVAIGNALGQGSLRVTSGTVTGLDQSISVRDDSGGTEQLTGLIESDASISPGDSGGPLVNSSGQVVGIITAGSTGRFRRSGSNDGFAIPANTALSIVNQIRAGHASPDVIIGQPGYLGVGVQALDSATAARLGLGVSSGVLVTAVEQGSPAERAGITQNAIITVVDGKSVSSPTELGAALHSHKPGQRTDVTWVDRAGTHTATVTLISGPAA